MSQLCLQQIDDLLIIFNKLSFELPSITSPWIKGCYSKYPLEAIDNIKNIITVRKNNEINDIIKIDVIQQIMKLAVQKNYKSEMVCYGFIRDVDPDHLIPNDIINFIDTICIIERCIDDRLQKQCISILQHISSSGTSQQIQYMIDNGIISILMNHINNDKTSTSVKLSSIKALGNIAAIDTKHRDCIFQQDIIGIFLTMTRNIETVTDHDTKYEFLTAISWTLQTLCLQTFEQKINFDEHSIEPLHKLFDELLAFNHDTISQNVCIAINKFVRTDNVKQRNAILDCGFVAKMIEFLDPKYYQCHNDALQIIEVTMFYNHASHESRLLRLGLLQKLCHFIKNGTIEQKQCVLLIVKMLMPKHSMLSIDSNLFQMVMDILTLQNEPYHLALKALVVINWAMCDAYYARYNIGVISDRHNVCCFIQTLCQFMKSMEIDNNTNDISDYMLAVVAIIDSILEFEVAKTIWGKHYEYKKSVEKFGGFQCLKLWATQIVPNETDMNESNAMRLIEVKKKINSIVDKYVDTAKGMVIDENDSNDQHNN